MLEYSSIFESYELVLEKDHRPKMIKFGIPENIADYLHELSNKYSIWFANQIKDMDGYKEATSYQKLFWVRQNLENDIRAILDWISNSANVAIKEYDWDSAMDAQEEYHDNLESDDIEGENNRIIAEYDNGIYWVDLETSRCREEGDAMGHCGTTAADTLFSLRKYDKKTKKISAKVTVAVSPNEGLWMQAKGKFNKKPDKEYFHYIADILLKNDVYEYQEEYNGYNDFDKEDYINTIQDDPDYFEKYGDIDEIVEKIESSGVQPEDFEEILNEYTFEGPWAINWVDFNEHCYGSIDFYLTIDFDKDDLQEYIGNIQNHFTSLEGENKSEASEFIDSIVKHNYPGDGYIEYSKLELGTAEGDPGPTSISLFADYGNFTHNIDKIGLEEFKRTLDDVYNYSNQFLHSVDVHDRFVEYLVNNGVIAHKDYEFDEYEDIPKKIERENKYQQEFQFTYDSYNINNFNDLCKLL